MQNTRKYFSLIYFWWKEYMRYITSNINEIKLIYVTLVQECFNVDP